MSQGQLAIRAGLLSGQPMISQYELDKVTPGIAQLRLLAAGLGCTVADLVEGL